MGKAASKERQREAGKKVLTGATPDASSERKKSVDGVVSPQQIKLEATPTEVIDEEAAKEVMPEVVPGTLGQRFKSFSGRYNLSGIVTRCQQFDHQVYENMTVEELRNASVKQGTELSAVYKAVAILNQLAVELDITKAVDSVRNVVLELLHCEKVTLFLVDEQQKELRGKVDESQGLAIIRIPFGKGIAGKVAETGNSMNIPDVYQSSLFNPNIDRKTGFKTRNVLCVPIYDMSGKNVAVVQALNRADGPFDSLDEANLELFGVHLGNTITKSRLHSHALEEKQRLAKLYDCLRHINTTSATLDDLVMVIAKAIASLLHAHNTTVLFVDSARDQLWTKWCHGPFPQVKQDEVICLPYDHGLVSSAARSGEAFCRHNLPDLEAVAGRLAPALGLHAAKSLLVQPVLDGAKDKVIAVLVAVDKDQQDFDYTFFNGPTFTDTDQDAMAVMAMEVGGILNNRSLEINFASALSIVNSKGTAELDALLRAQLQSYAEQEQLQSAIHISRAVTAPPIVQGKSYKNARMGSHNLSLRQSLELGPPAEVRRPGREEAWAQRTPEMKAELLRWDLDFTKCTTEELVKLVYDIFGDSGVVEHFDIEDRKLMTFIAAVCTHYHDNPYHNFCHVTYVLHSVYLMMMTTEISQCLRRVDQLVLLISALCHDIDHDGHTNGFHMNTYSPLAQRYNDLSVMENHHCAMTFAILARKDCTILEHLDKTVQKEVRKLMIGAILATDMSHHFGLTTEFKNHAGAFSVDKEDDRTLLNKIILHAADISNPVRTTAVNMAMSQLVHAEFRAQVSEELALGITPLPHMNAKDEIMQAQLEMNFIDCVVRPLWEHMALLFPAILPCVDQIDRNKAYFQRRYSQLVAQQKAAAIAGGEAAAEECDCAAASSSPHASEPGTPHAAPTTDAAAAADGPDASAAEPPEQLQAAGEEEGPDEDDESDGDAFPLLPPTPGAAAGDIVKVTTWPTQRLPENLVPRNRDTKDLLDALLEQNAKQAFRRGSLKSRHFSLNMLSSGKRESWGGAPAAKSRMSCDTAVAADQAGGLISERPATQSSGD